MSNEWTAEHIQRRMSQIRHELDETVEDISGQAKQLQDWRYYVRQYPWFFVGTAAALGYLMVPDRPKVFHLDNEKLADLGRREKLIVESRPGIAGFVARTALAHLSNALMGSAAKYFGQRLGAISEHAGAPETSTMSRRMP